MGCLLVVQVYTMGRPSMFYNHLEESHAASEMAEMTYRQCGPDNLSQSHKAYSGKRKPTPTDLS